MRGAQDYVGTLGDLVMLVWTHKLWWLIPLLLSLLVLAGLLTLQATPIGPLIYPIF